MLEEQAVIPREDHMQRRIDLLRDRLNRTGTNDQTRDAEIQARLQKLKVCFDPSSTGIVHGRTCEIAASKNDSSQAPKKEELAATPTEGTGSF